MKYESLPDFVSELERRKENSRDVVVATSVLKASSTENGNTIQLQVPRNGQVTNPRTDCVFLQMTPWAHRQIAEKCKIPLKYYDKILGAGMGQLLADNVNAWMQDKDKRLVRILDNEIRAILSDRYRVMDNHDVAFLALEKFKEHGAKIQRCDLTDTRMYIKAIVPELQFVVPSQMPNDVCTPGIILKNSEVGSGRFSVEPFILRKVCTNGLIAPQSFARVHLGSKMDLGEVFSDETKALEDKAIWAKVNDLISAAFDKDIVKAWADKLVNKTEIAVPSVTDAIDNVVGHFDLAEGDKKSLLDYFSQEPGNTAYALVNAVTRAAQDQEDYEKQIALEKVGGRLVEMTESEWQGIVLKSVEA